MPQDNSELSVSFEFFPPQSEAAKERLWRSIEHLAPLQPRFVSVTYGADGSTRDRTHELVTQLQRRTGLAAAAHLTCVGATREEIQAVARGYRDEGINHIVALRGDPPRGCDKYVPCEGGFAYATDLISGLAEVHDFEISVAAYPESHPEAPNASFDLENLRRKVDAGATRAITQFFFDADIFLRFRDRCADAGIDVPIVPGILPVTNFARLQGFASACGASVPGWLHERFEGLDEDPGTRNLIAANTAIEQVQALRANGVQDFHFYTLNRHELTYAICHALGVRAQPKVATA